MKINDFLSKLSIYAPLSLSKACIDRGDHDNSGIIVKVSEDVNKVLFTLDLSKDAAMEAVNCGCDCIVTHHPAIYYPILGLDINSSTGAIIECIKNGISVISMHLNLDMAKHGIDDSLAFALGGKDLTVVDKIDGDLGYGKEFKVNKTFSTFIADAIKTLRINNYMVYGDLSSTVNKAVSFCGGGSSTAVKYTGDADLIITTDMPHHIIKEVTERGKKILLITHYASEFYGFTKFFDYAKTFIDAVIFDDKKYL